MCKENERFLNTSMHYIPCIRKFNASHSTCECNTSVGAGALTRARGGSLHAILEDENEACIFSIFYEGDDYL